MAWTPIDTGTPAGYEFAPFAALAFAGGCFADGIIVDPWATIVTNQSPGWNTISTGTPAGYPFNTFANLAIGEGAFADGNVVDPWTLINTVN